jgi:hypothetical protein
MKKSAELKQLRAQKIEAQTALRSTAVAETRDLNDDETIKFRSLQTESKDCQVKSMMQWHTRKIFALLVVVNLQALLLSNRTKSSKSFFSLNKAIRSMVEGTPLKELKRSERKRSSCCTCCRIGVAPSLQCHCLKLELTVKR